MVWRKQNQTDSPISYLDTLEETAGMSIEATLHKRLILFAKSATGMEDTILVNYGGGCEFRGESRRLVGLSFGRPHSFRRPHRHMSNAVQDEE